MKTKIVTIILSVSLGTSLGQDIELFGVEYARYPNASVIENDSVEVNLTEYEVSGLFPVLRKEKFNLLAGGTYRLVTPQNNEGSLESNLFFLGLNLTGAYTLSDGEKLVITAFPSVSASSNSETFSGDSFLMQGGVFYNKNVSDRFSYNLGVISTSRFGSLIFLPFFGMTHSGEKMRLDVTLPVSIRAMWNYKKRFAYGIRSSINGSQYSLDAETATGTQVDLTRFSRVRLGPEIEYRIKGPLVFTLFGGLVAGRTYEFEVEGFDDVDFSLDNGPFIAARLSFRPQLGTN